MLAYRRLPLDGLMNARDLGGYAACGGVTRSGVFLRSDVPALLSGDEVAWLDAYHAKVRQILLPLVDGQAKEWLVRRTQPL